MFLGRSSLQQINHTNTDQESSNQGYVGVQREREKKTLDGYKIHTVKLLSDKFFFLDSTLSHSRKSYNRIKDMLEYCMMNEQSEHLGMLSH